MLTSARAKAMQRNCAWIVIEFGVITIYLMTCQVITIPGLGNSHHWSQETAIDLSLMSVKFSPSVCLLNRVWSERLLGKTASSPLIWRPLSYPVEDMTVCFCHLSEMNQASVYLADHVIYTARDVVYLRNQTNNGRCYRLIWENRLTEMLVKIQRKQFQSGIVVRV